MGKIFLVGFGPGAAEQMTLRARQAIEESEVVIGYSTYIKLVADLLDGKEVIRKGMTEELDRSLLALERAKEGKTVALISSGDIGVYGMAGPTYEVLFDSGWTPDSDIKVEVVPGTTALSAAASLVGAPLTHDFCSISLSDLLTPWAVIARRLEAAAKADFVVALYNPKSGRRTGQIIEAQNILLQHRDPATPVALVKSAYRKKQQTALLRLDQLAEQEIGMLTTLLVGNSNSFVRDGLLVTPRGYANKYQTPGGEAREGEQAGRSLSSGLEGWGEGLLRRIEAGDSPDKLAQELGVSLGLVLTACGAGSEAFELKRLGPSSLDPLRDNLRHWGGLRMVVRGGGSIVEVLGSGSDLQTQGDWLNLVRPDCHLHLPWSQGASLYLSKKSGEQYAATVLNQKGELLVRFGLLKTDGQFSAAALEAFKAFWRNQAT